MIVKITRGDRVGGLLRYLVGGGRANEHTDPTVVGGDPAVLAGRGTGPVSAEDVPELAARIDRPRRVFGTQVNIPNWLRDSDGAVVLDSSGAKVADLVAPSMAAHVWHCSLSLAAAEGELTDERWGGIVGEFMEQMGFGGDADVAPARWVAIRHGHSVAGNDHVHIAASLVREDGSKVDVFRDYVRASAAAAHLERKHGLSVIESREAGIGERGLSRAELERVHRGGEPEPGRRLLERRVRAAATAARSEGEFVRRLRAGGVWVRPRFARGSNEQVVGYKVALRPDRGGKPVYFGGGHLARDLTLPRLRAAWAQWSTPELQANAALEWRAASRSAPVAAAGPEARSYDPKLLVRASSDIGLWNQYLASIPVSDRAGWARAATRTAGMLSAWSCRVEQVPGPIARAAQVVGRGGQIRAQHTRPVPKDALTGAGATLLLAQVSKLGPAASMAVLAAQLIRTVTAIADAARASGQLERAHELAHVAATDLQSVHNRFAQAGAAGVREVAGPDSAAATDAGGGGSAQRPVVDEETRAAIRLARLQHAPDAEQGPRNQPVKPAAPKYPQQPGAAPRRGRGDDLER